MSTGLLSLATVNAIAKTALYRGITVATGRLTFLLIVCGLDERHVHEAAAG